ncbi:MAG TPA: CPBP family intramembrane glutamic endopeptidase [Pseudonocardiaceae bacterium]
MTTPQWPDAGQDGPPPPHPSYPPPDDAAPLGVRPWPPTGAVPYPPADDTASPGVRSWPAAGPAPYPPPDGYPAAVPPGQYPAAPYGAYPAPPPYLPAPGQPAPGGALVPTAPGQPAAADRPPPHKWGFGAFLLAEAVFLLASLIVPAVATLPYLVSDPDSVRDGMPLPGPVLVAALSIPPLLAAAVALLATRLRGNGPVADLRLRFGRRDVGIGVACGVAGVFLTVPLGLLWASIVGEDNANSAVGEVFDGLRMPVVLAVIVFLDVWLLAPICEEIIFRGLLWGAMERREWNRWLILVLTTALFSLAHFELLRAPLLLAIGLPIAVARLLSGRLIAPIIAHQINNFLPALVLMMLLLGHPLET